MRARDKRYGYIDACPKCHKTWFHEDKDYIVNDISWERKLQCPYCKTIFAVN